LKKVEREFIRRAVEASDLAALRVAVYQACGDEELASFAAVNQLGANEKEELKERLVHLIDSSLDSFALRKPPDEEIKRLMAMALGAEPSAAEFELHREVIAFEELPFFAFWPEGEHQIPADFHVAIIGCGFNGIATAVQLSHLGIAYTIYERRHEIGGTWSINKYPDVRVDTLSAAYEFCFERNYPWKEYFARGADVRSYLEFIAEKYGVTPNIRFEHDLKEARFDEERSRWELSFTGPDGDVVHSEVNAIVSAAGLFANPKNPDLPGAEDFKGLIIHPTQWPTDLDLRGKNVAILGNGSTGVQLLAPVAEIADRIYMYQRTPQWISPRDKYGKEVESEIHWLTSNMPGYWNWCRYTSIMHLFNFHKDYLIVDAEWQKQGGQITKQSDTVRQFLINYITDQVGGRQDLIDKLTPDYAPMVRRPVVDNGWYKALARENAELITYEIVRVTENGIETSDGEFREVDIIITATGFEIVKYLWPAEYIGRGGVNLHERWAAQDPRAYVGMMVPDFPNLFMLYGPNSQPISGGVALPAWYQMWASFVAQCLMTMIQEDVGTVEVTQEAFTKYNEALDEKAAGLLMLTDTSSAKNYYLSESGRMQVNAPWETADYYNMVRQPNRDEVFFA